MLLQNIKEKCKEENLTLSELERKAGIPERSIYRWDELSPSFDKVVKVAAALNCSVEELVGVKTA